MIADPRGSITLTAIVPGQRGTLANLYQLYLHDMSAFVSLELDTSGRFVFDGDTLDQYFRAAGGTAYFIRYGRAIAGFVLVRRYPPSPSIFDIEQFFVLRGYRGLGVGRQALAGCLARHPGRWQIRVMHENRPAQAFWQRAIAELTGGRYVQAEACDGDLPMCFFTFASP
ncbi:GNAT family N-acetyltransferase [Salinisphaera sp. Q1T1-3]|uniref:GNAT family N-acetyltransferase n=1 Tax=Salinisphaera sp. Q1T1-3 TaxID=2321229 RepID=UPI001313EBF1|nr:GNAT family N-acetyltransferase [Salinisphaera sp. Q1T1-3]